MKKTYINPRVHIWKIASKNICIVVGSGNTASTSGNGTVLTKEGNGWWDEED